MARDWMWGLFAFLPSTILAFWGVMKIGISLEREWLAVGAALAAAATISTVVLWMMNSRSIAARRREGLEVELIVRPLDALEEAAFLFPMVFGVAALLNFILYGQMEEWGEALIHAGIFSWVWTLWRTAYRKPKPEAPD